MFRTSCIATGPPSLPDGLAMTSIINYPQRCLNRPACQTQFLNPVVSDMSNLETTVVLSYGDGLCSESVMITTAAVTLVPAGME